MDHQAIISIKNASVSYKRSGMIFKPSNYFEALKSISFDIYPGETLGILGRNGAGKSTLLKLISGILLPNKGIVINRGVSVALLALQAGFDHNLNGRDNAILSGMLQGFTLKQVKSQLEYIKEYSELGGFFEEPVRTYSTGMVARLGFSITTMISPDVLLVDEVLGVGDKHFRQKAEKTMMEKINSQKQTVVLVSHSHQQVVQLCSRAILIDDGKSLISGDPIDVIEAYEEKLEIQE